MGFIIALSAFVMDLIEETLIHFKDKQAETQIEHNNFWAGWFLYVTFSGFVATLSCVITTYWGPGAAGSGVAEVIGYLSGINYPETISFQTYVTKVFGVVLAIAGGLTVGKEGPLAHIGANAGAMVAYMGGHAFAAFQNDHKRRAFIAAGSSAGVSVAFGAPIGSALFMFELTRQNPFWKFETVWKTFVACCSANMFLALFEAIMHGNLNKFSSSTLKFGEIKKLDVSPLEVIPGAIILGVITGIFGSYFVYANFKINAWRARTQNHKWHKPIETFLFAVAITTVFYWAAYLFQTCIPRHVVDSASNNSVTLDLKNKEVLDPEAESKVF